MAACSAANAWRVHKVVTGGDGSATASFASRVSDLFIKPLFFLLSLS